MSFFHVSKLIKKVGKMVIYEDYFGRQWAGDCCAAYRLYDMPGRVNHDHLFDMMDVAEDKRSGYGPSYHELPGVELGEYGDHIAWGVPVMDEGCLYQLIRSRDEAIFILEEYLKPLRTFKEKEYRIEILEDGTRYLIVSLGKIDLAVIRGEPVSGDLVKRLEYTLTALQRLAEPSAERLFDPETGEIYDEQQGSAGAEDSVSLGGVE